MKRKIIKYTKFLVSMVLILGLVAPSYASLSASDGSAFVTKAEFDSALADFNSRLTTFEAGINSKIDSQVTSYLDRNGIWNGKELSFYDGYGTNMDLQWRKWGDIWSDLEDDGGQWQLQRSVNLKTMTTENFTVGSGLIGKCEKSGLLCMTVSIHSHTGRGLSNRWMTLGPGSHNFLFTLQCGVGLKYNIRTSTAGTGTTAGPLGRGFSYKETAADNYSNAKRTVYYLEDTRYSSILCSASGGAGLHALYGEPIIPFSFFVSKGEDIGYVFDLWWSAGGQESSIRRDWSYGADGLKDPQTQDGRYAQPSDANNPYWQIVSCKVY